MNDKPIPVTFSGDEYIYLDGCYVFRDGLAHRANVSIASAVSYTEEPNLFCISIAVPGSKKMTLAVGIPFPQALRLARYAVLWDNSIDEFDACKIDVVRNLVERHVPDLTAVPWTEAEIEVVRDMETSNEMQESVRATLLEIAEASLEGPRDE